MPPAARPILSLEKRNGVPKQLSEPKMMKFLHRFPVASFKSWRLESSIFNVSLFSTQTQPPPYVLRLYRRLQSCNRQRTSVIPVLNEWVAQGRRTPHRELEGFIKTFRSNNRNIPALEIAEWMSSSMKHFTVTPGHVAIQLDLMSKVRGIEHAESFFNGLEDGLKDFRVYTAMLNCYAEAKLLDRAEAIMEKIKELSSRNSLPYNVMLSLYSKMGMHDKLDPLMQEMESKGIDFNVVACNIRLNAYADSDDLEGMEKLLMKMEADPRAHDKYRGYCIAAKGYTKGGYVEKASMMLKKAEHMVEDGQQRFAYGPLISCYATLHQKEEVYRLWNMLQNCGKLQYESYAYMLNSLEKLDDLDGAKKIVEDLVEKKASFDIRTPNIVIGAYCRKGDMGEAEVMLKRVVECGKKPCSKTWSHMALGYYKNGRMEEAVEATKKSLVAAFNGWKPDPTLIDACLEYMRTRGDEEGTREMLALLHN